jgi:hypothetical protein
VKAIDGDASCSVRDNMVNQRTRQLRIQKTAIKFASRSAVRSFDASAREDVLPWEQKGYPFAKRQSQMDSNIWVSLVAQKHAPKQTDGAAI